MWRDTEQGMPTWDERLAARTTFFFTEAYLGTDGYHRGDDFYMLNWMWQTTYRNEQMSFAPPNALRPDDPAADRAVTLIREMQQLTYSWIDEFVLRREL